MKRLILSVLAAASLVGPAAAQAAKPLPSDPGLRAAACTAILSAMAGTVRASSADMANELDGLARRWRARAETIYRDAGKSMEGEQAISAASLELIGQKGLPGGTFDKSVTCQNEAQSLPN